MHSTGVTPMNRRRSSSTGCGNLDRLLTHRMRSEPSVSSSAEETGSRTKASTLGLEEVSSSYMPVDRKSTRLNSSHDDIYTLSLHDALPIWMRSEPSVSSSAEETGSRTKASTLGLEEVSSSYMPVPKTGCRLRISIIRLVHCSSEPALRCWASTFSDW